MTIRKTKQAEVKTWFVVAAMIVTYIIGYAHGTLGL